MTVVTWFQAKALVHLHGNSCLIESTTYCETLHISYSNSCGKQRGFLYRWKLIGHQTIIICCNQCLSRTSGVEWQCWSAFWGRPSLWFQLLNRWPKHWWSPVDDTDKLFQSLDFFSNTTSGLLLIKCTWSNINILGWIYITFRRSWFPDSDVPSCRAMWAC